MGKSNDAPETPDYSELAEASEAQAKYAYDLAQRQQDWAEKVYADNKGVSDIVIDMALGEMDKMVADSDWARDRYHNIFAPLEEQLAYEAENYATPERLEQEAGKAEADVAAQFEQARRTAQERLEGYGVDPSQTRQGAMDLGTRVAEAASQASAGNQARWRAEEYADKLRADAIAVGQGYAGQITGSSNAASGSGNQATNTGLATTASGASTMGTGTDWTSQGNSALSTWGNLLNQDFSNQMSAYEAEQQSSSGWGDLAGTLAGAAFGKWFAEGGAIPDEEGGGYIPIEASPSGGAATDDVKALVTDTGQQAQLNAGEFVIPEDVVSWLGEKGIQQLIMKARKEMTGSNGERPAQPTEGPAPPPSYGGAGIPEPQGAI